MSMRDSLDSLHDRGVSLATRTIVLEGEVDAAMTMRLFKNMNILQQRTSSNPMTIVINSEGGDVQQALAMYDLIQASDVHITTVALGDCMSSACIILQAGDLRKSYASSTVMYHQGTTSVGETPTNEVKAAFSSSQSLCKRSDDIVYARMKSATNLSRVKFDKMLDAGIYLMAPFALREGLIDEVLL
tara:strand:+ start:1652 stop:2212 length:561 start_codon:yes stop_codon:yes gene_type:complete